MTYILSSARLEMGRNQNPERVHHRRFWLAGPLGGLLFSALVCLGPELTHGQTLGEALDTPELVWTTGGATGWYVATNMSVDGVASVQSSSGQNPSENWLQTTNAGAQAVTFWWRFYAASRILDSLELYAGTNLLASCTNTTDWIPKSVLLPAGEEVVTWKLSRRNGSTYYSAEGWLDQVSFSPPLGPSFLLQPTNQTAPAGDTITLMARVLGTEPLSLQWLQNGTNVASATNETLTVKMQATNAGEYQLVATNLYGAATSQTAVVTVIPSAPVFTARPQSQGVPPGGTAYLTAAAKGTEPLSWQWYFDGTEILDATARTFTLSNITAESCGLYSVVVGNAVGSNASAATVTLSSVGAWGTSMSFGRILIPPDTANVVALAGGDDQSIALQRDGTVVGWGRFGIPIFGVTNTPPSEATNVVAIGAGSSHCLAARDDGSVLLWGKIYQPLGVGSTNVPSLVTNVAAVALGPGAQHAVVLRTDGSVVDWGINGLTVPAPLMNAASANVVSVAGGSSSGLALKADGKVVQWGGGVVTPPFNMGPAVAIACGWFKGLALMTNGTVVEWGGSTPPASATNVVAIAAGGYHSLALRRDGSVVTWGGDQITANVPGWATNIAGIACLSYASMVLLAEGPPCFTPPLIDRYVLPNGMAIFNAVATGESPISYQWRFNGTDLPGATNTSLILRNVNTPQLGYYSLLASNRLGSVSTRDALLTFGRANFRQDSLRLTNRVFYFTVDGPVQTNWRLQVSTNGVTWSDSLNLNLGPLGSISSSVLTSGASAMYRLRLL